MLSSVKFSDSDKNLSKRIKLFTTEPNFETVNKIRYGKLKS